MNLSNDSKTIIKYIIDNNKSIERNYPKNNNQLRHFIKFIYKLFSLLNNQLNRYNFIVNREISETSPLQQENMNYFPEVIRDYINNSKKTCVSYKLDLDNRQTILNFYIFNKKDPDLSLKKLDAYAKNVSMILLLLQKYSDSKSNNKGLTINIFMTHFKRNIDSSIRTNKISTNNLNGGFTRPCQNDGNITVYRKEEWFKVVIHECFHSFGLDFCMSDLTIFNDKIRELFPINSEFNIYETYCELWAEILNACFCAFELLRHHNNDNNQSDSLVYSLYENNCILFLEIERSFSKIQCLKVLDNLGINYSDILKPGNNYSEKTNVFAYIICTYILMFDINKFINWTEKNNDNYFRFNSDNNTITAFYNLIRENYKDDDLIAGLNREINPRNNKNKFIKTTLRMSAIEIC